MIYHADKIFCIKIPIKLNIDNRQRFQFDITFHKLRKESYAKESCYFAVVKKMLSYVFAKGTLRRINLLINVKYNFSFVKTMLLRTLHWNSLIFVSNDTLNESEYVSF